MVGSDQQLKGSGKNVQHATNGSLCVCADAWTEGPRVQITGLQEEHILSSWRQLITLYLQSV